LRPGQVTLRAMPARRRHPANAGYRPA
jgi:hypothetical protein